MGLRKLKAGALQLTTMIAVVIALLLVAFVLLIHTHKRFALQIDFILETIQIAEHGLYDVVKHARPINDTVQIPLEDETYKSLKVHSAYWGIFKRVTAVSKIKSHSYKKTALIGGIQEANNRTALYLQDNNKPLVLVGNTHIQGIAYLPKQGVKPGTISGQSYYGSQFINGVERAALGLPKLDHEALEYIQAIDQFETQIPTQDYLTLEPGNTYKNSFFSPLKCAVSNSEIRLNNIAITGHIIIQSRSKITITASSKLKDVLLIAPEISIEKGVKGNFQAFANRQIEVKKDVVLQYPSALVVDFNSNEDTKTQAQDMAFNGIHLDENSEVRGSLIVLGKVHENTHKPQIILEENSSVYGEVYCQQNTELKGSVFGTVYTNNFIANQFGSIYQNHLYHAKINVDELPPEYSGLPFKTSKQGIAKWLY